MKTGGKFAWSVRREIWEHRAIYIAPLVVAALSLLAFLVSVGRHARPSDAFWSLPAAKQAAIIATPYGMVGSVILFSGFMVGLFFCLDALHAEKRDRSILFWKSMPVSDRTTVLAKAFIPFAVLPTVVFTVAILTQVVMLLMSSVIFFATGVDATLQWKVLPLGEMTVVMLYGLVVHTLWFAPLYAYLLLVSVFAKRAPFLWATMPFLGLMVVERIAIGTSFFIELIKLRLVGAMQVAFSRGADNSSITGIGQLEPMQFLASPGLWLGLIAAAIFIAFAVYLRRRRDAS